MRDNMHVLISKGIEGSAVPEVNGNVRVEQLRSFMAIRPHPEKAVCLCVQLLCRS